jgi:hypothetical protein
MDFDSREMMLTPEICEEWEPAVKEMHLQNRRQIQESLIHAFGAADCHAKRKNSIDLGRKPLSVLAFQNAFSEQLRLAFVTGAYYPALTVCSPRDSFCGRLQSTFPPDETAVDPCHRTTWLTA